MAYGGYRRVVAKINKISPASNYTPNQLAKLHHTESRKRAMENYSEPIRQKIRKLIQQEITSSGRVQRSGNQRIQSNLKAIYPNIDCSTSKLTKMRQMEKKKVPVFIFSQVLSTFLSTSSHFLTTSCVLSTTFTCQVFSSSSYFRKQTLATCPVNFVLWTYFSFQELAAFFSTRKQTLILTPPVNKTTTPETSTSAEKSETALSNSAAGDIEHDLEQEESSTSEECFELESEDDFMDENSDKEDQDTKDSLPTACNIAQKVEQKVSPTSSALLLNHLCYKKWKRWNRYRFWTLWILVILSKIVKSKKNF